MRKAVPKTISADKSQLDRLIDLMPDNMKFVGTKLAGEMIFIMEMLEKLKKEIESKGVVEEFKQGRQQFLRESPALKSYNTTARQYSMLCKQFIDMLPKQVQAKAGSDLLEFVRNG